MIAEAFSAGSSKVRTERSTAMTKNDVCGCGNRPLVQLADLIATLEHRQALVNRITAEIETHMSLMKDESFWANEERCSLVGLVELLKA
jgi:hypothetical protein